MRAVIIYESMFGSTHAIADAIGKGPERLAARVRSNGVTNGDGQGRAPTSKET